MIIEKSGQVGIILIYALPGGDRLDQQSTFAADIGLCCLGLRLHPPCLLSEKVWMGDKKRATVMYLTEEDIFTVIIYHGVSDARMISAEGEA